jgi:hypothetical protein
MKNALARFVNLDDNIGDDAFCIQCISMASWKTIGWVQICNPNVPVNFIDSLFGWDL